MIEGLGLCSAISHYQIGLIGKYPGRGLEFVFIYIEGDLSIDRLQIVKMSINYWDFIYTLNLNQPFKGVLGFNGPFCDF